MSQRLTLTLPDQLYAPIERTARATHQPVESVVLSALQASLPPLQDLSADLVQELTILETLDDESLRSVLQETMPTSKQRALGELLLVNQAQGLDDDQRRQLDLLRLEADRLMLRKARAAVLMRFRGLRVPSATEMRHVIPNAE